MKTLRFALAFVCLVSFTATAQARFKEEAAKPGGAELGEAEPQHWQIGFRLTAAGAPCGGITGYVPVPVDWPEQKVRIVDEDVSSLAKISYKTVHGKMKLMVVKIGRLPARKTAQVLVTYEVTHRPQLLPETTDQYVLADPRKLPSDVRRYLRPSPKIESKDAKIKDLLKKIEAGEPTDPVGKDEKTDDKSSDAQAKRDRTKDTVAEEDKDDADDSATKEPGGELTAWEQVELIYDWVRDNVDYKRGPQKSAVKTLKDRTADCEGMTSLFIALCRAKGVPARTVWVQGHCYPEFYLTDKEEKGYWFPCQVAGGRAFGGIPETRPIWQKGDDFTLPDMPREHVHYLPERIVGKNAKAKPQRPQWVRKQVNK